MADCLSHENSYKLQEGESLKMASPSIPALYHID